MREEPAPAPVARRDPADVMQLSRLGSFHQTRLSFMRVLTRRMAAEGWRFTRPVWQVDATGVGHAVYSAQTPTRTYSLVAFAHDLPAQARSDRVIAQAWDATFALFDGVPEADDIARLARNVPKQEAGRVSARELSLSRANRSVRLWDHVIETLAAGRQPDADRVAETGYLMRTTAVYGSGKFGAADRARIAARPEMMVPFQAEMLSVYLTRAFVRDLVEHIAQAKGGTTAVRLDPGIARSLGIGNSTGLGMAPFIVNHPVLFNNWIVAREEAIARVRGVERASEQEIGVFQQVLARAMAGIATWHSAHPIQIARLTDLRADLGRLHDYLVDNGLGGPRPWDRLARWGTRQMTEEGQELVLSLMLEPYGALVDGLATCMADQSGAFRIDGAMPVAEIRAQIAQTYGWALDLDWDDPEICARAWYVSEEKLEPRLGERFEEPIAPYEQPLAPGRDAAALDADLAAFAPGAPVAQALLRHPEHRHMVRRVQLAMRAPYGEIRDNTIGAGTLPIDMLRCKLSFFGATRFDPRSDRWVRITMYAGAPYPEELVERDADLWVYPETEDRMPCQA